MANLSGVPGAVMAQGNEGRTIAAFVIDESGETWLNDGSGLQLWENMAVAVSIPEPSSIILMAFVTLALVAASRAIRSQVARA